MNCELCRLHQDRYHVLKKGTKPVGFCCFWENPPHPDPKTDSRIYSAQALDSLRGLRLLVAYDQKLEMEFARDGPIASGGDNEKAGLAIANEV